MLIYVAGLLKLICEFTITLLTASNGTSSMHAESGDTESSGGSGSIDIKYKRIYNSGSQHKYRTIFVIFIQNIWYCKKQCKNRKNITR